MTTSIRLKPSLLGKVDRIAAAERRARNNWLQLAIEDAVARYLEEHPEMAESDDEPRRG